MRPLGQVVEKQSRRLLGLMSGTSCDGLDLAYIKISDSGCNTRFELLHSSGYSYNAIQKKSLLKLIGQKKVSPMQISQLNFYLARIWSEMITTFLKEHELKKTDIDFIGSHGQTIWHEPQPASFIDKNISSTLQLGDPSVLAQLCGIPVVGDFRVADVALGGQGAPLIPYFDWIYFSRFKKNLLAVNIGGISNLTFVPADGDFEQIIAFDCGPGNMLLDAAMRKLFNKEFDSDGQVAKSGKFQQPFIQFLKKIDSFADMLPPKSTGRELYNQAYLQNILTKAKELDLDKKDILYNLTWYSASCIFDSYLKFIHPKNKIEEVAVGGGGAHNTFLMGLLAELFGSVKVKTVASYGLDQDFKEAIGFAVLANETIQGVSSNVPFATGASRRAVLGKICLV